MELWQYFKHLPFEYTVEGFYKKYHAQITVAEKQWREDTGSTMMNGAHTEWSINKHLSAFPDYYHDIVRWRISTCVEMYLVRNGQNLQPVTGHIQQYCKDNAQELNRLYKEFCKSHWLAPSTILSSLFRDGVHNYRKFIGQK
jgi:hypothetical protein